MDGGDTLTYSGGDWHFTAVSGTLGAKFNLPWSYDQWSQDFYLFDIENVLRCWYDYDTYKFKFDVYTVSGYGDIGIESPEQAFEYGWHDVAIAWDNTDSIAMSIDGGDIISYSGIWAEQTLPDYLYVGSDYSGEYQIDGAVDDVFDHDSKVSDTMLQGIGDEECKYLPVNSFLIDEQNATLIRKNVGATM